MSDRDPIPMRLCDDDGMVSNEPVGDPLTPGTRDASYLERHNRLRGMTHRPHLTPEMDPFFCTGSAHLAHEVFTCTSPAHRWSPSEGHTVVIASAEGTARVEEIIQRRAPTTTTTQQPLRASDE